MALLLLMATALFVEPSHAAKTLTGDSAAGIPPVFEKVGYFSKSRSVVKHDGQWGVIDGSGTFVVSPQFEALRSFNQNRAAMRRNDRWGFIDRDGSVVSEPSYDRVGDFSGGYAPVNRGNEWGYVDQSGRLAISLEFDRAEAFGNRRGLVTVSGRKGFINRDGKFVISPRYNDAHPFSNGLAAVEKNDLWGYITSDGSWAIDNRYIWASPFHEKRARVLTRGHWGLIDRDGVLIDTFPYDFVHHVHDGRVLYRHNDGVGYLNPRGESVIPARFQAGTAFRDGLAAVKKNDRWGFIDKEGNWVIQPKYEMVSRFSDRRAAIKSNDRWGFLRHPEHSRTDDAPEQSYPDPSPAFSSAGASLVEQYPGWRAPGEEVYVSIGPGISVPEWHIERGHEVQSYGKRMLIYEVTRFPHELPTYFQRDAARALREQSRQFVEKNNWDEQSAGLSDGYTRSRSDASHFFNPTYINDTEMLSPQRPEYLIYTPLDSGKSALAGMMYLTPSGEARGHQVGGPLTKWHYHLFGSAKCFRYGKILLREPGDCEQGEWSTKSLEMLHVWFLGHPQGPFGTRMTLPRAKLETLQFE